MVIILATPVKWIYKFSIIPIIDPEEHWKHFVNFLKFDLGNKPMEEPISVEKSQWGWARVLLALYQSVSATGLQDFVPSLY